MATYILLRNNVETKSLSLEELQALGLRPSDMVWVECQSWDWQRPQEIPELKWLLEGKEPPAKDKLENQPKPASKIRASHTTLPDEQLVTPPAAGKKDIPEELLPIPAIENPKNQEQETTVLPGLRIETSEDISTVIAEQEISSHKPAVILPLPEKKKSEPEPDSNMLKYGGISGATTGVKQAELDQASSTSNNGGREGLQTNYSRSLDEIKELYVKNLAKQGRLGKTKERTLLPTNLKKVAIYIGFAAAGAVMVMLLGNNGNKKNLANLPVIKTAPLNEVNQNVTAPEPAVLQEQLEQSPAANETIPVERSSPQPPSIEKSFKDEPVTGPDPSVVTERKPVAREEELMSATDTKQVIDKPHPKKANNTDDLISFVSVETNDYTTGSFGGIRNLQLTVKNGSKYLLDEVAVELKYLNLDNITVNTEQVIFRSIEPGQPETIAVKKSRRGLKVKYKVVKIESRAAYISTASH